MNKSNMLLCAHSAPLFCVLLAVGWFFIPGWFPPITPNMTSEAVAAMYEANRLSIRVGLSITALASGLWWPFNIAIAFQMRRIEGRNPILSVLQAISSTGNVMIIMFAAYFCLVAAFRAEFDPSTIQAFHDIGWLMMIGCYCPALIGALAVGICIVNGNRPDVYPRWLGYFNIWMAFAIIPGALLPFFYTGPFAWNGLIGFWFEANVFFAWILIMWWFTVRAIRNQPETE